MWWSEPEEYPTAYGKGYISYLAEEDKARARVYSQGDNWVGYAVYYQFDDGYRLLCEGRLDGHLPQQDPDKVNFQHAQNLCEEFIRSYRHNKIIEHYNKITEYYQTHSVVEEIENSELYEHDDTE